MTNLNTKKEISIAQAKEIKSECKFLNDESYANIFKNLESGNNEEAFRAAHTLKGICQNLGFNKLFVSANTVTEALRNGKNDVNDEMLAALKADYELTAEAIKSL